MLPCTLLSNPEVRGSSLWSGLLYKWKRLGLHLVDTPFGCVSFYLGQNIAKFCSVSACLCFAGIISSCVVRVPNISVLKFSSKFLISAQVTSSLEILFSLVNLSRSTGFSLMLPRELLIHKSIMSAKFS